MPGEGGKLNGNSGVGSEKRGGDGGKGTGEKRQLIYKPKGEARLRPTVDDLENIEGESLNAVLF